MIPDMKPNRTVLQGLPAPSTLKSAAPSVRGISDAIAVEFIQRTQFERGVDFGEDIKMCLKLVHA